MNAGAPKDKSRRLFMAALALAGLGLASYRAGWLGALLPKRPLPFEALDGLPGFRVLDTGNTTFGAVPLFGLDGEKPEGLLAAEQSVRADICGALFGETATGTAVPIAYFFDFQCPLCRRLTPRLRALSGVAITWHDLAGLGPASDTAARAAIAAGFQGAYDQFHERLMRSRFQANLGYVETLANSIGIDAKRLLADMESPEVSRRMWLSRAAASRLGMVGTPGLVVGRTVIIGDINDIDLARIIAEERRAARPCSQTGG